MIKNTALLLVISLLFLSGCQKDDICPESTNTTPHLVIKFLDSENPLNIKEVTNLQVKEENSMKDYFETPVSDSLIKIPLRTTENFTNYIFTLNTPLDPDAEIGANDPLPNEDQLHFNYGTLVEYVGRACGYKTEFVAFEANRVNEEDDTNWIKSIEVLQPNDITNEFDTHLYIYH
ncbi:DUF6452 family protein [Mesonia sp. MT50]|uniref:DUF6452 family protein n=1 Tax=Mesonia profundi TaxID=3070998 RepID=A0ABU1A142_9FLAO|nr:DUF6452 family protein [Mesonia profundi]MDQ7917418.1 DUF6452 family protein [Mesonia profundi]